MVEVEVEEVVVGQARPMMKVRVPGRGKVDECSGYECRDHGSQTQDHEWQLRIHNKRDVALAAANTKFQWLDHSIDW